MEEITPIDESEPIDGFNPIRVETALSRFPIHRLSKTGMVEIDLHNQASAIHWEVTYNSKYGQPGPLAYKLDTLVINRRIDEIGKPVPEILKLGSLREIAEQLDCEGNTNIIKKALYQNAFAAIEAKFTYRTQEGAENWIEEGFSRYSVILTGEKLPNGRKADAVYLRLHPTYRHILNSAMTRPLDYNYMKTLGPTAQRLYEIVSYQIHYAVKMSAICAKLRYSTYCLLAPTTRYLQFDQVKKQMHKVHRPHIQSGYIREVKFEETIDEAGKPDWLMLYKPGPNADRWYQEFVFNKRAKRVHPREETLTLPFFDHIPTGVNVPILATAPKAPEEKQATTNDSPETLALITELKNQELNGADAERLAREKPDECRRQLEYLAYVKEFKTSKGAYLRRAIEEGYGPPKGYETARLAESQKQKKETQAATTAARQKHEETYRSAYEDYLSECLKQAEKEDSDHYNAFTVWEQRQRQMWTHGAVAGTATATRRLAAFDKPEERINRYRQYLTERTKEGKPVQSVLAFWEWDTKVNPHPFMV